MEYEVLVSVEFQNEFRKLPREVQPIARKFLEALKRNPKKGIPLKHKLVNLYSLHFFGNRYRIIYTIEEKVVKVLALAIGKRTNDFYKKVEEQIKKRLQLGERDPLTSADLLQ